MRTGFHSRTLLRIFIVNNLTLRQRNSILYSAKSRNSLTRYMRNYERSTCLWHIPPIPLSSFLRAGNHMCLKASPLPFSFYKVTIHIKKIIMTANFNCHSAFWLIITTVKLNNYWVRTLEFLKLLQYNHDTMFIRNDTLIRRDTLQSIIIMTWVTPSFLQYVCLNMPKIDSKWIFLPWFANNEWG